jgi:hypothetical protein
VTASDQASLRVGVIALVLAVSATPAHVDVAKSLEAGSRAPVNVTVKVSFENQSKNPIDGVQLISLDIGPVDRTQALPKLSFSQGSLPISISTFRTAAPRPSAAPTTASSSQASSPSAGT